MSTTLTADRRFVVDAGRWLGAMRIAIGLVALVRPQVPAAPWVGREAARATPVRLFARTLGARDLALGIGAVGAADRRSLRLLVGTGALADTCDALATLAAFNELPRRMRWVVLATTSGAAVTGALIAAGLRD